MSARAAVAAPAPPRVAGVTATPDGITVDWGASQTHYLSSVLRPNCMCEACRHAGTNQRLIDVAWGVDPDTLQVAGAVPVRGGAAVRVTWLERDAQAAAPASAAGLSPGAGSAALPAREHVSEYPAGWLREHSPLKSACRIVDRGATLWDAAIAGALPAADYAAVMGDDAALLAALTRFREYGFVVLRGAPAAKGVVTAFANRVAYVRHTHYGATFEVKSERAPESLAYTPAALGFHTDLPYREDTPGVQLLHCIENSATGGASTLLDGFKAASDLAQADPASFALLASTPVTFTWQGREGVFLSATKRTITLEPGDGVATQPPATDAAAGGAAAATALPPAAGGGDRLSAIYYDNRNVSLSFAYLRSGPGGGGQDKALLRAYRTLAHHFNTPRNKLAFKMVPGDVLVFNNKRCLHGREAFDPRTGGRLLEGCYMDGDMVLSRARGLTRKLAHELDARFLAPKHLAEDEERRDAGVRRAAAHV